MDFEDIISNEGFLILTGVGILAFSIMLIVLSKMGQSSIMPLWVKIVVPCVIPIIAYLFAGGGD